MFHNSLINKIILNIRHSDDYTDYLLMTSAITDRRVVPMLDPDEDALRREADANTLILRCDASDCEPREDTLPAPGLSINKGNGEVIIYPKYYLSEGGGVNPIRVEMVKSKLNEVLRIILYCTNNIHKLYLDSFPSLWHNRQIIYGNPKYHSVFCGRHMYRFGIGNCMTLGSVLKAMEENADTFLLRRRGVCNCQEKPFVIDYRRDFTTDDIWTLHTWCPCCQSRQALRAEFFERAEACDWAIYSTRKAYGGWESFSNLTLFDVLDYLK